MQHLDDLQETFDTLKLYMMKLNPRKETFDTLKLYMMKLNPRKYAFRVALGKFLGFLVS